MIKHSDTEITVIGDTDYKQHEMIMHPEQVYIHQEMSKSSIDMHPRIITKDASYSFIWIDDHIKTLSNYNTLLEDKHKGKKKELSKRGFCNLFTIFFIFSIILFLFIYPFITVFYK